nr:gamma-glutamylcyclotransferase family protein [uncultured Holophaga sp.]
MELSDLYFAYGPDMDPKVLKARGGRPEAVGLARLQDYRLDFFGHTSIWDSGMETVVPAQGDEVWGVLYRMGALDWDRLDTWMDARLDGAGMYFHYPVAVTDLQGMEHQVRIYKKDIQGERQLPSVEYLQLVVGGAGQQGLPAGYVERLAAMPTKSAGCQVPVAGNPTRGNYVPADCGTCAAAEPEVS